jgi:hypothetical protein
MIKKDENKKENNEDVEMKDNTKIKKEDKKNETKKTNKE